MSSNRILVSLTFILIGFIPSAFGRLPGVEVLKIDTHQDSVTLATAQARINTNEHHTLWVNRLDEDRSTVWSLAIRALGGATFHDMYTAEDGQVSLSLQFSGRIQVDGHTFTALEQDALIIIRIDQNGYVMWVRQALGFLPDYSYDAVFTGPEGLQVHQSVQTLIRNKNWVERESQRASWLLRFDTFDGELNEVMAIGAGAEGDGRFTPSTDGAWRLGRFFKAARDSYQQDSNIPSLDTSRFYMISETCNTSHPPETTPPECQGSGG